VKRSRTDIGYIFTLTASALLHVLLSSSDAPNSEVTKPVAGVSGTTVRALVLGRFSQKLKIELKDNAKNE